MRLDTSRKSTRSTSATRTSRKRSSPRAKFPWHNPVLRPILLGLGAGIGILFGVGCGRPVHVAVDDEPSGGQSLLYWQVEGVDSPPPHDIARSVRHAGPDVAVLEISHPPAEILQALEQNAPAGIHSEQLSDADGALVILCASPLLATQSVRTVAYRMAGTLHQLRYGILDVTIRQPSGIPTRIIAASIKNKTFHPAGQSEMRRNELRLVTQHVQRLLETSPGTPVILVGALNDSPEAAGLRGLLGETPPRLLDLRPTDSAGDAWTSHEAADDSYRRNHYALTRQHPGARAQILDDPTLRVLSRHRPIWLELHTAP